MKNIYLLSITALFCILGFSRTYAQDKDFGLFNSLAIGVNAGTTGVGFDVATPIGNYLQLRVGMNMVPDITFDEDIDVSSYNSSSSTNTQTSFTCNLKGSLKRTTTDIILNCYPFKKSSFFIAGGLSIGGKELVKIKGHSDEAKAAMAAGKEYGIEIGDYNIPFDKNGDVAGGIKVASSRPYVGFGFGRAVPKKRIGCMFELGVQFHNTPKIYSDYGSIENVTEEADNKYTDIINNVKAYPVLRFRLCGRII